MGNLRRSHESAVTSWENPTMSRITSVLKTKFLSHGTLGSRDLEGGGLRDGENAGTGYIS
jgi:hypothetical protein